MLPDNCYAVVMAGGAGTRLWPLSSRDKPKHFLRLFDGRSLIEMTVDKLKAQIPEDRILILTSVKYRSIAREMLPQIPAENFVYEPCLRDTASAIGLAATVLSVRDPQATMIVSTADQIIEPDDDYNASVASAASFLEQYPYRLVAFGVEATGPSTLVGWQKLGASVPFDGCEVREIAAFTEKPDRKIAEQYIIDGGYCWNSGHFAWRASAILSELDSHLPETSLLLQQIGKAWNTPKRQEVLEEVFPQMPRGSIDYKVMQQTTKACSILLPCSWEDMGTHAKLAERIGNHQNSNLVYGKTIVLGNDNVVLPNTGQHVVIAASGLTVVVTEDTVLVAERDTDMKALFEKISDQAPEIV